MGIMSGRTDSLSVILDKCCLIWIPKTGSTFVHKYVRDLHKQGITSYRGVQLGSGNAPLYLNKHKRNKSFPKLPSATFVRHPLNWYKSYWLFRTKKPWNRVKNNPNLRDRDLLTRFNAYCASNDFNIDGGGVF